MMKLARLLPYLLPFFLFNEAVAQNSVDSLTDNLVHLEGYESSEWGQLPYQILGSGKQSMIILPGAGFDGSVFQDFCKTNEERFTMYVVTLPGYGDSKAYAMPPLDESYGQQNWISGVKEGILRLIEEHGLQQPVLLGHSLVSTDIVLHMAKEHDAMLSKVIVIGGPLELKPPPPYDTLGYANRVKFIDKYMAPIWFKTVSRETWLAGNFPPETYSIDSTKANLYWEMANEAPLPVHIRYLCENWGSDYEKYKQVKVPVLIVVPSFAPEFLENELYRMFIEPWTHKAWMKVASENPLIQTALVNGAACNVMNDQPKMLNRLLVDFLKD